jgi:hypothetical protein
MSDAFGAREVVFNSILERECWCFFLASIFYGGVNDAVSRTDAPKEKTPPYIGDKTLR